MSDQQILSQSEQNSEVASTAPAGDKRASRVGRARTLGEKYGLLVMFGAVVAFFGIWGTTSAIFLSHANLLNIVSSQMIVLLIALAVMVPLMSGYIDLSCGAAAGASSIACATMMARFHEGLILAICAGIFVALLIGLINGILVARFKLGSVIATLAMSIALSGIMEWYTNGQTIGTNISIGLQNFGSGNWLGIPRLAYVGIPITLLVWYLQEYTPAGRDQQATSSSERAARLVGVNVNRVVFMSFVSGGLIAGIAGVLLVAQAGAADSSTGPSYLFPALAAVFLGATTIRPGRPSALGTLVGVFFVAVAVSGLTLAGASTWVSDFVNGIILFVAAGLSTVFARERGRRMF